MRLARAFGRWDVDRWLSEIDHDQYEEWIAFQQLEPDGWRATSLMIKRLSYMVAQSQATKTLDEAKFEMKMQLPASPATKAAIAEAMSIRAAIQAGNYHG